MAVQIDAGDNVKRSDIFRVDPTKVLINDAANVRHEVVTEEQIVAMMESIQKYGQLQPINARRLPNKKLQVFVGVTRLKAIQRLHAEDPRWRVAVQVFDDVSDQDAFLKALSENLDRNDMNLIDHAYVIGRMIEDFAMTAADVAKRYGWSATKVSQVKKLRGLPKAIQSRVANGSLGLTAALQMRSLDTAETAAILEPSEPVAAESGEPAELGAAADSVEPAAPASQAPPPKIKGTDVAKAARAKGIKVSRTASDLRKVLNGRTDPTSVAILAFFRGEGSDDGLEVTEALDGWYERFAEPEPEASEELAEASA